MSLINPVILFGLALAAIPVLLHFLMKAKPKKLTFPALQLIKNRKKTNSQRMRLKHFWLLLLRVCLIGLMVLAIARPSLPAANYGLSFREGLTLGGIIAAVCGVYWWLTRKWKKEQLPIQALANRTNTARTGSIIGAILLALLLVLWPYSRRVAAEAASPNQSVARDLPVAAVFLFDVSPSMGYQFESQTRLEVSQSISKTHLESLPQRSRVAVTGNASSQPDIVFQADLMSAQSRIEDLAITPLTRPFNERLRSAIELQKSDRDRTIDGSADGRDQFVREVYVFSDLTRPAWNTQLAEKLRNLIAENDWMHIYLVDVGIEEPINTSIKQLKLSQQSISAGGELVVEATVTAVGRESEQAIEVYVTTDKGDSVKLGQAVAKVGQNESLVSFPLQGLKGPVRQGEVRLVSTDPLLADDIQYFTVNVTRPTQVLIIGESNEETKYLEGALGVAKLKRNGGSVYEVKSQSFSRMSQTDLKMFDVVCLVNPRRPDNAAWNQLQEFVSLGGGLAVFAGTKQIDTIAWDSEAAGEVLPASLQGTRRFFKGPFQIETNNRDHPLMSPMVNTADGTSMFALVDFFQGWIAEPLPDATVIATYSNEDRSPAFLERNVGKGKVILFTNSIENIEETSKIWNNLVLDFPFVVLADSLVNYLGRYSTDVFNYSAGQTVVVRLDSDRIFERYLVRKPGFQQIPGDVPEGASVLTLSGNEQLGHYEVVALEQEQPFRIGFSVNIPAAETDLTRLVKSELDGLLGAKSYSVARQPEELDRVISDRRVGREIFPLLLLVAIVFFCGEHFVANWFYGEQQEPVAA